MADTDNQNQKIINLTDLSGAATHVPHRAVNSNRKTGSPRSSVYEAHSVAPQTKLDGPRITRNGDSSSLVAQPPFKMVLEESNVLQGQPLHPLKHALQLFTDASNEGWGTHLNNHT